MSNHNRTTVPFSLFLLAILCAQATAAVRTKNFVVIHNDYSLAQKTAQAAEAYRKELAILWFGREFPQWSSPCEIRLAVAPRLGNKGATSFSIHNGEVFGWHMTIQGTPEAILTSVLKHEVSHTVFYSHFRRGLPRWLDEGAAISVEQSSERTRYQRLLVKHLQGGRGIPFRTMFAIQEYPNNDPLPLYSQGSSVVEFLLQQRGHDNFVKFVTSGLDSGWEQSVQTHYAYKTATEFQDSWNDWVRSGSPRASANYQTQSSWCVGQT